MVWHIQVKISRRLLELLKTIARIDRWLLHTCRFVKGSLDNYGYTFKASFRETSKAAIRMQQLGVRSVKRREVTRGNQEIRVSERYLTPQYHNAGHVSLYVSFLLECFYGFTGRCKNNLYASVMRWGMSADADISTTRQTDPSYLPTPTLASDRAALLKTAACMWYPVHWILFQYNKQNWISI